MIFIDRRRFLSTAAFGLLFAVAAVPLAGAAQATPSQPPIDYFFYVTTGDSGAHAQALGCNVAHADISHARNSEVVLDFGAQDSTGSGTTLPSTSTFWTNSTDEYYATQFSLGYQTCHAGSWLLVLGVGTNNSGPNVGSSNGGVWGRVVQAVVSYDSSHNYTAVHVDGASDIESWGSYSDFNQWENGASAYTAYTATQLINFGSADGCSDLSQHYQNVTCSGDWTTSANYNAAWHFAPNVAAPEIYYPGGYCGGQSYGNQSMQWANISMFGVYAGANKILFLGPLWDGSSCFSSSSAEWTTFYNALVTDGVAMSPYYQFQITTN